VPDAAERAALRTGDPGAWALASPRPAVPVAGHAADGSWVPVRSPAAGVHQVALDAFYSNGPDAIRNTFYSILPTMRSMPAGLQRIGGVDYDVRGMVQLGIVSYEPATDGSHMLPQLNGVTCLPVAGRRAAAVHLLLRPSLRSPVAAGTVIGHVTLHYADGSEGSLPLRAGVEVPSYSGDDRQVPQAFVTFPSFRVFGLDPAVLSTPRLANPYPDRVLECIDLSTVSSGAPLLLLGLTLEPAAATPPAPATTTATVGSPP